MRALLMFAEGQPIAPLSDKRALQWHAVHGANLHGEKGSLEDRVKWTVDNSDDILASATEPLKHRWWTEAKKPWQFLAWAFEYAEIQARIAEWSDEPVISRIPIALDGACNGSQHRSLLMRHRPSAAHVYLTGPERKTGPDFFTPVSSITEEEFISTETIDDADGNPILGPDGKPETYEVSDWGSTSHLVRGADFYTLVAEAVRKRVMTYSYTRWLKDERTELKA